MPKLHVGLDFIPRGILRTMSNCDIMVWKELCLIFNKRKEVIALEYVNITPSEVYISQKTGYSRQSISKSIKRLVKTGLLHVRQQRSKMGRYALNTYRVGIEIMQMLKKFIGKAKGLPTLPCKEKFTGSKQEELTENYSEEIRKLMNAIGVKDWKSRSVTT